MYLHTDGLSTPPRYCTSNTPKPTPMMIMQHPRHHKASTLNSSPSDYAAFASSTDIVKYYCSCFAPSHCASSCSLLNYNTRHCIINQRHITLENLPPRNSYYAGRESPRNSRKSTPSSFRSRNRSPRRTAGTIPNTHYPGSRILNKPVHGMVVAGTVANPHPRRERPLL